MTNKTLLGVPDHWPSRYNAFNEPCDMIDGPCCCGAWHSLDEDWVKTNVEKNGLAARESGE